VREKRARIAKEETLYGFPSVNHRPNVLTCTIAMQRERARTPSVSSSILLPKMTFDVKARVSRTPESSLAAFLQLIFGLGTPLQLDRESVIVGVFTKMQYALPSNATDFTEPGVYYSRAVPPGRSRWSLYKMFEKATAMYGFGGKECLLRAICEVAHMPFDVHHGLLGQLLQAFLR